MKNLFIIILFLPTLVFSQYKGGEGDGYFSVDAIVEDGGLGFDNDLDNNNVSVYPNPFSDSFNISLNETNPYGTSVKIFNVNGVAIDEVLINEKNINYNKPDLPQGIYFVQIWKNNKLLSIKKVIKN